MPSGMVSTASAMARITAVQEQVQEHFEPVLDGAKRWEFWICASLLMRGWLYHERRMQGIGIDVMDIVNVLYLLPD